MLVLDTCALTVLLDPRKGDEHQRAKTVFSECVARAAHVVIPSAAVYEMRRGLLHRGPKRLLRELDRLLLGFVEVEDLDQELAEIAAHIWAERAKQGRRPGEIDVLIVATARGRRFPVVTYDQKEDFPQVPDVPCLTWSQVADAMGC